MAGGRGHWVRGRAGSLATMSRLHMVRGHDCELGIFFSFIKLHVTFHRVVGPMLGVFYY